MSSTIPLPEPPALKAPDVAFGLEYRDRISGFTGYCTGISRFISGCDQVLLVPKVKEGGEYQEGRWFDDDRLVDVAAEKRVERSSAKGGPQHTPPVRS